MDAILHVMFGVLGVIIAAIGIFGEGYRKAEARLAADQIRAQSKSPGIGFWLHYLTPLGAVMILLALADAGLEVYNDLHEDGERKQEQREAAKKEGALSDERDKFHVQLAALVNGSQAVHDIVKESGAAATQGLTDAQKKLSEELARSNTLLKGQITVANGAIYQYITEMNEGHVKPLHQKVESFITTAATRLDVTNQCVSPTAMKDAISAGCKCTCNPAPPSTPTCNCVWPAPSQPGVVSSHDAQSE